jgi:hypothetical protein
MSPVWSTACIPREPLLSRAEAATPTDDRVHFRLIVGTQVVGEHMSVAIGMAG